MSDRKPLMPKATAVWLVDNTALTFDQIAALCGLHPLEVKGIADGDVAQGIKGMDPVNAGELTRDEIERGEKNPDHKLRMAEPKVVLPQTATKKKRPRYTPVSRRQDRPNAVLWLLKQHPELKDSQIIRLVGTTKPTITQIRDRTHWNTPNLVAQDPVTLGLCKQIDLDAEVQKAAKRVAADRAASGLPEEQPGGGLLPTSETVPGMGPQPDFAPAPRERSEAEEDAEVFARLQRLSSAEEQPDSDGDDQPDVVFPEVDTGDDAPAGEAEPAAGTGEQPGIEAAETAEAQSDEPASAAESEDTVAENDEPAEDYGVSKFTTPVNEAAVKGIVKFLRHRLAFRGRFARLLLEQGRTRPCSRELLEEEDGACRKPRRRSARRPDRGSLRADEGNPPQTPCRLLLLARRETRHARQARRLIFVAHIGLMLFRITRNHIASRSGERVVQPNPGRE